MHSLKYVGFNYSVALESGVIPIHFKSEADALKYCKLHYPNTLFQIIPIPLFAFEEGS